MTGIILSCACRCAFIRVSVGRAGDGGGAATLVSDREG